MNGIAVYQSLKFETLNLKPMFSKKTTLSERGRDDQIIFLSIIDIVVKPNFQTTKVELLLFQLLQQKKKCFENYQTSIKS